MAVSMGDESEVRPGLSGGDAAEREGGYIDVAAHGGMRTAIREITMCEDQDTSGGG
jgi:hypothetical protein